MKLVSWNVNGLRAILKKGNLQNFIKQEDMDVLLLQETKLSTNTDVDPSVFESRNFYNFYAWKKGYSGTAILVKNNIKHKIKYGIGVKEFDIEGRVINLFMDKLVVISAYFPNSQQHRRRIDYKLAFCSAIQDYLKSLVKQGYDVVLAGDYNVAHKEIDLARPDENRDSPGFLPEERDCLSKLFKNGFIDVFRYKYPDKVAYSWWSYRTRARERNVGWRIDYHSVNSSFIDRVIDVYYNNDVLGSDHCPITIEIEV